MAELIEICPFDQKAAVFYGDVRSALEKKGETIGSNDLLIAAKGKINGEQKNTEYDRVLAQRSKKGDI